MAMNTGRMYIYTGQRETERETVRPSTPMAMNTGRMYIYTGQRETDI